FKIQINDFRERLDIPASYRMTHINQKVLTPIINELGFIFQNLNINKIQTKKSRKIEWLEFTFEPEKRLHNESHTQIKKVNNVKHTKEILNDGYSQSEHDPQLEKDRAAFLKLLREDWRSK
ncbi:hypothetical protein TP70_08030, partial [Staphylococcus microti]